MKTIYDYYLETGCTTLYENKVYGCGCTEKHNLNMQFMVAQFEGTTDANSFEEYVRKTTMYMYVTSYDAYKVVGKDLVLERHFSFACPECEDKEETRIYCVDMERPVGFDDMELQHGICAFCRNDIESGIKHLVKVLEDPNYETCCSTDYIGTVGATFIAEVLTASNEDLYTQVNKETGHRYFENHKCNLENIIYDVKDHKPSPFFNDEFVTRNHTLKSLWYKTNASEDEKEAMISLAEFLGVEVKVIGPSKKQEEQQQKQNEITMPVANNDDDDDLFAFFNNNPIF